MADKQARTKLVRSRRGGQITIPAEFRHQLGIHESSVLRVTLEQGELRITPVAAENEPQGTPWLRTLYDAFAPVREEASAASEEEIDGAITAAVAAVRQPHA